MKKMVKSVLMILLVMVCTTSLAFAGQARKRNGDGARDQKRDGSCQLYQSQMDGQFVLARGGDGGNGNGGNGDNGGNGPGDGTGNGGDGPGDGTGNGPGDCSA